MNTKVEQASSAEPQVVPSGITANSSAASTSSPKVSMFAKKSGFVIPKNKLSGSLIPIFRGAKKPGGSEAVNEEGTEQVQRKTKWGPDLTEEASVRKGRALAYQIRVDQITQQLKSGTLDTEDDKDLVGPEASDHKLSGHQIKSEKSGLLELEKQELIGEILKLNPSYKAPPDYKPLLKEAKVPVPIKDYPGYNFIGLFFGSANDTQKRLEKETGAKIRVYGTKANTGEKAEINSSDGNEASIACKELYVHVSADTYEKVDAAVALIELLVTPISVNSATASTTSTSVTGDNVNVGNASQGPSTLPSMGVNQEMTTLLMGSAQTLLPGQSQPYTAPWFPTGSPQIHPPIVNISPAPPIAGNPVQVSSSPPFPPSNLPSLFGSRPVVAAAPGMFPGNFPVGPSRPQFPLLRPPYMPQAPLPVNAAAPRNHPLPFLQASPIQPTGNSPIMRPLAPSLSQPVSISTSGPPSDWQLTPAGSSAQWSQSLLGTPTPGLGSMAQMPPPVFPQGPPPVTSQAIIASGVPPSNLPAANMAPSSTFHPRPSVPPPSSATANHPIAAPTFTSGPQPQLGISPASSLIHSQMPAPRPIRSPSVAPVGPIMMRPSAPNPSQNPIMGSLPIGAASMSTQPPPSHSGIPNPISGNAANFTPIKPPMTAPKPQNPNPSDFTFQPHLPQNPASQAVPRPGIPPASQNILNPAAQPPQAPAFRPSIHTSAPQSVIQGVSRPQLGYQMNQPPTQMPQFGGNPPANPGPIRHPPFSNTNPIAPMSHNPAMGPRSFSPASQVPNLVGPFPLPGNPPHLQQNFPATAGRPQGTIAPNQQLSGNLSFASVRPAPGGSGAQQIYDPFSPTSIVPQQGGNQARVRKQDNDPEYEDLMASVGVK